GAGIAVLPQWFVEDELRSGTLVNVLPNWSAPTLTIHLAFLPNRHQPRRLSVFLDLLQKHILSINGINPV
ncbi:MAG: LysR substrate-binding domain-containing protein, partial [Pseudomonadota bacterium]